MPKYIQEEQMKIDDFNNKDYLNGSYAMSNEFLRLPKDFDISSYKILGLLLSKLNFKIDNSVNGLVTVEVSLSEIIKACGSNSNNYNHYRKAIAQIVKSSYVDGNIDGVDIMGFAVPLVTSIPNTELISYKFELFNRFMPYFQQLASNYTLITLEETKNFKSKFTYTLYLNLMSWKDSNNEEYYRYFTTKNLKELFGLSKDDYCRKDGKFDRNAFERNTIEVAIKEMNEKTNLKVAYKKEYKGRLVKNYVFNFIEYEV